jgi:hypothetical protein
MEPASARPRHSVAPHGRRAWSCRCGTGTSAGADWSQPTARTCAAGGPPDTADAAGPPCSGMIVRPPFPQVPFGLAQAGTRSEC